MLNNDSLTVANTILGLRKGCFKVFITHKDNTISYVVGYGE